MVDKQRPAFLLDGFSFCVLELRKAQHMLYKLKAAANHAINNSILQIATALLHFEVK